jgi:predicted transcriptional regulator
VKREKKKSPTEVELEILRDLWKAGPSTVRDVYLRLSEMRKIGYTSVLKMMQIMTEKSLLDRDATVRPQMFKPTKSRAQTQRHLLRDLVDRAFSGSAGSLALQALSTKKASAEERQQIRDLLDRLEREEEDK